MKNNITPHQHFSGERQARKAAMPEEAASLDAELEQAWALGRKALVWEFPAEIAGEENSHDQQPMAVENAAEAIGSIAAQELQIASVQQEDTKVADLQQARLEREARLAVKAVNEINRGRAA